MIALSPLTTWLFLLAAIAGVVIVVALVAIHLDDVRMEREMQQSLEDWRRMCEALRLYDYDDERDDQ